MRARIAQIVLGEIRECERIGGITLHPHQQSAVARARAALEEFGGVLLCDDVGMGKTFVATAIARQSSRTLIVTPAALASMWRDALAASETTADLVTFERLSRTKAAGALSSDYDLIIVDEAHHAKNPTTQRYRSLAKLARNARVLLLTATPIHNRASEMHALLSLFLGSRGRSLTTGELARCVVRREHSELAPATAIPLILPTRHLQVSDNRRIVQELMDLPPPLPVRDGGLGGALIGRGLVHQWASSDAALREAVQRRIAKAAALAASLESGHYPTAIELETWIYGEGALQLGFPELLSSPVDGAGALLDSVRFHLDALQEFHGRYRLDTKLDAERADILARIRKAHTDARIVAFAQYAETVSMLFRRLSGIGGVAMLTARGGMVAGGRLTRDETLARFAPRGSGVAPPPTAQRIDLLLTTDLLSEGVNLQDADVVIHLDVPWTAARMEQRVGRVARLGSIHPRVQVYLIRPPATASAVLGSELLVRRKWDTAKRVVGSSANAPFQCQVDTGEPWTAQESVPAKNERLRAILESWRRPTTLSESADPCAASVRARRAGFVAAVSVGDKPLLLCSVSDCASTDLDSQIAACLLSEGDEIEIHPDDYESAVNQIHAWFDHNRAAASAGIAGSRSRPRRRLLNRIDSAVENASPHIRAIRSRIAARARQIATNQHGASLEAELELLADSPLPDHELLETLARLESARRPRRSDPHPTTLIIHAVLLLRDL